MSRPARCSGSQVKKFRNAGETYCVAGFGNPGIRYQATPHNIGFRIVDELAGATPSASPKTKARR